MNIVKKILLIFIVMFLSITLVSFSVNAFSVNDLNGKTSKIDTGDIDKIGGKILTIATTIGSVVSIVTLIIIGIKYMMGSVEEKANYKKTLLPYFIGAIFVFAASTIVGTIYNVIINTNI